MSNIENGSAMNIIPLISKYAIDARARVWKIPKCKPIMFIPTIESKIFSIHSMVHRR